MILNGTKRWRRVRRRWSAERRGGAFLGSLASILVVSGAATLLPAVEPPSFGLQPLGPVFLAANDAAPDPSPDEHDPMMGIESNGRIPRVALPSDLANPERWRYVPEGRISPGGLIDRLWVSSFVVPIFFFEGDVGAGGGLSITDIDFRNQRRQEFAGIYLSYTSEGQQSYSFHWRRWRHHRELEGGGVAQEERSYVAFGGGYRRTLTRRFFGLGPDTRERDETSFTDELTALELSLQNTVPDPGDDMVIEAGVRAEHRNLSHGVVSDVPDTKHVFPQLFDDADSFDSLWTRLGARYDTRDSQHNPYHGFDIGVTVDGAPLQTGGDSGAVITAQGSAIVPMPPFLHDGGSPDEEHPPTDVIAIGGMLASTAGDVPFWALPSLGGSNTLRGYIGNRYTGEAAWHGVVEYRFWAIPRGFTITKRVRIERLGMALFAEVGSVASGLHSLSFGKTKTSYGFSMRASLERQALFRADFGFSPEGFNFTASYGLSF
ncbi:MAG: BamA/TamA family outer membrane protein [Planctomycetes bacterium]|nr:BamA/TamA family outer membrane protein [Planctomycetota bacterium]